MFESDRKEKWLFVSKIKLSNRFGGDWKGKKCLDAEISLFEAGHDYSFRYNMEHP